MIQQRTSTDVRKHYNVRVRIGYYRYNQLCNIMHSYLFDLDSYLLLGSLLIKPVRLHTLIYNVIIM